MKTFGFIDNGDSCHLYVMVADGKPPVKVGISTSPWCRLQTIQTACPFKLGIAKIFTLPTRNIARKIEADIHYAFEEWCLHGEWFNIDPGNMIYCISETIEGFFDPQGSWSEEERAEKLKWCGVSPNYGDWVYHDATPAN